VNSKSLPATAPCAAEVPEDLGDDMLGGVLGTLNASAERLLIGASVFREAADRNALLFQIGEHDWTVARDGDPASPAPPYRIPADLPDAVAACVAAGVLTVVTRGAWALDPLAPTVFVDREIVSRIHEELAAGSREHEVVTAHLLAAEYWKWRAAAWPQSPADIHDLLEARYHLLAAGEVAQACDLTEIVCTQLHAWGDLDREATLISDMLGWLPEYSIRRAGLLHGLGRIAQIRQDHATADQSYRQALRIFESAGDRPGASRCHHGLGMLAQARGAYAEAELSYEQAERTERGPDPAPASPPVAAPSPGPASPPQPEPASPPEPEPPGPGQAAPARLAAEPAAPVSRPVAAPRRRPAPRWRLPGLAAIAVIMLALATAQLIGVLSSAARIRQQQASASAAAAAVRRQAAAWVSQQVSSSAIVACDPAMCAALRAQGIDAGNLLPLGAAAGDPLGSDIVLASSAVRSRFGLRLTSIYAPDALASFGTGSTRIQILVTAPDGTAAYRRALAADIAARRQAGAQLLRNDAISVSAAARQQLAAGAVDSRLLITLAALAGLHPVMVLSFGRNPPGASSGMPLRSAEITDPAAMPPGRPAGIAAAPGKPAPAAGYLRSAAAFLHAQRPPYLAAGLRTVQLPDGQAAMDITYASPSPLGLLSSGTPASTSSP
jgi:tetratricopeptide (TPR) repeat protein